MLDPYAVNFLAQMPLFQSLSEDELQAAADQLTRHTFPSGGTIIQHGTRADAIYMLEKGTIDLFAETEEGRGHLRTLHPGDPFGYEEVLNPQPRRNMAIACDNVVVLRWNRAAAVLFLRDHPLVRARFERLLAGIALAERLSLEWLREDETIYAITRRHPFTLLRRLIPPTIAAITGIVLLLSTSLAGISPFLSVGAFLAALTLSAWHILDWRNDYGIITNRRAIWTEKIIGLYDSQQEAPLSMVLSISVSTSLLGRFLRYGDVLIRTYTGKLRFNSVPDPHGFADQLEEQWRRLSESEEEADRTLLRNVLHERLHPSADNGPTTPTMDAVPDELHPSSTPYARWSLRVRFEQDGIITYRKHWAVLLRDLALPVALILISLVIWLGHISGWLELLTRTGAHLLALGTGFPLIAFSVYRFIDWSNDLYQITPTHIVDIYRRPLSRERKKVAPLANILGTEVLRRGAFGLLLNVGDVVASVGTEEFTFEGVFNPSVVQQDIVHAQEALLQREQVRERLQRQEEMVELIDIYHEQYASEDGRGKESKPYDGQESRHSAQQDTA